MMDPNEAMHPLVKRFAAHLIEMGWLPVVDGNMVSFPEHELTLLFKGADCYVSHRFQCSPRWVLEWTKDEIAGFNEGSKAKVLVGEDGRSINLIMKLGRDPETGIWGSFHYAVTQVRRFTFVEDPPEDAAVLASRQAEYERSKAIKARKAEETQRAEELRKLEEERKAAERRVKEEAERKRLEDAERKAEAARQAARRNAKDAHYAMKAQGDRPLKKMIAERRKQSKCALCCTPMALSFFDRLFGVPICDECKQEASEG